jgi:hypothetical protein
MGREQKGHLQVFDNFDLINFFCEPVQWPCLARTGISFARVSSRHRFAATSSGCPMRLGHRDACIDHEGLCDHAQYDC